MPHTDDVRHPNIIAMPPTRNKSDNNAAVEPDHHSDVSNISRKVVWRTKNAELIGYFLSGKYHTSIKGLNLITMKT